VEYLGRSASPPLDAFVERIWYCADTPAHERERVIPSGGNVDLIVNLAEDEIRLYDAEHPGSLRRSSGTIISGTHTRSYLCDPRQRASVVGVHFKPGRAFPFIGISPAEIVDAHAALRDLWGGDGTDLREQLLEATSAERRFRLIEAALLRRLKRARAGHPAVRAAVEALRGGENGVRVADVAAFVGLSHRRFVEVFEREVGLTPKFYARIQRFHRVKRDIAALRKPPSWAAFALARGYFDQSHMIRDFVEFSSMSPESYLQCRGEEARFDHLVHAYEQK
jgi:AraC-like DNA-binding protein